MEDIKFDKLKNMLQSHPNMSLYECIDHLEKIDNERRIERAELLNNRVQFYKDLVGKYFMINFNNVSFCVMHIVNPIFGLTTKEPTYDIYRGNDEFKIRFEDRPINKFWFNCPYEEPNYGNSGVDCTEITEEEFKTYEDFFNSTKETFSKLNLR